MKNNVNIMVFGEAASGKSNVVYLLKRFLREQGFTVELKPDTDHANEETFDKAIGKHHSQAIAAVKERAVISIEEKTINAKAK